MLRRGFTSDEIMRMPLPDFYELWLFEMFLEPQSPVLNDFYQARLAQTVFSSNPNLTKEARSKYSMKDYILIKDKVFLSDEEQQQEREKAEEANKAKIESLFDPKLLERARAKSKQKKVNNE